MADQVMSLRQAAELAQDEERLLDILNTPNPSAPMIIATRRDVGENVLRTVAKQSRPAVLLHLIDSNADRLPSDVLQRLAGHFSQEVRNKAQAELRRRNVSTQQEVQ